MQMIGYIFARRLANQLRNSSYYVLHPDALTASEKRLSEELVEYLNLSIRKVDDRYPNFMHHIEVICKEAINNFAMVALTNPTDEMKGLLSAVADLYNDADQITLLNKIALDQVASDVFVDALSLSKLILRECYADLVSIRFLRLTKEQIVTNLLRVFADRDKTEFLHEPESIRLEQNSIRHIRIMSAILAIDYASSTDLKRADHEKLRDSTKEFLESIDAKLTTKIECLSSDAEKSPLEDQQKMINKLTRATETANEFRELWEIASVYLHKSNQLISNWFDKECSKSKELNSTLATMRKLFSDVSAKGNDAERLAIMGEWKAEQ